MRWVPFALLAVVGGCQCLQPVVECPRRGCHAVFADAGTDGGRLDAGLCVGWDGGGTSSGADGGPDASTGYLFLGDTCDNALITQPVTTPGVFTSLEACVQCGCDPAKFTFLIGTPGDAGFTASTFCDQLDVVTGSPQYVNEAFPDLDGGCLGANCTVWRDALDDAGVLELGDAGLSRACQASLVTNVSQVRCTIFIH
jgi:hypothetical protein